MTYQVKNVKTFHGHDGGCWECTLYNPEGKRVAVVTEDGWGGELQFHWLRFTHKNNANADSVALDTFCATLPKWASKWDDDGAVNDTSADIYLGDLVNTFLDTKEVKKLLKKVTILDGKSIYTYRCPPDRIDAIRDIIEKKHPKAIILNEIPLAEAVALYRKAA